MRAMRWRSTAEIFSSAFGMRAMWANAVVLALPAAPIVSPRPPVSSLASGQRAASGLYLTGCAARLFRTRHGSRLDPLSDFTQQLGHRDPERARVPGDRRRPAVPGSGPG